MNAKKTGRLCWKTELAVGMRGMVQVNIATEADLANGSRGMVTRIIVDPRECVAMPNEQGEILLQYPPACVVFKLDHSSFPRLAGLDTNEIVIVPSEASFAISSGNGKRKTVQRRQITITC